MAKPVQKTGKTIPYGTSGKQLIVRDDKAVSAFVDAVTEVRTADGVFYVSFAQTVVDGTNTPELDVLVRLRMTVDVLEKVSMAFARQVDLAKGIKLPTPN